MEDYDEFVQRRLSQLRKSEDNQLSTPTRSSNGCSLIRFHGQPILPPVLSGRQREEMQRHREAVQKAAVQRKSKADARVAYVQTILHSVELRKTPTLEEFFQESGLNWSEASHSHTTSKGSVFQSDNLMGMKDSLSFFSPSSDLHDGKDSVPPLTSTTYHACSNNLVTPQQSYLEDCFTDQKEEKQGSQSKTDPLNDISHQSLSSGYVTYNNGDNTSSVSGRIEAEAKSQSFGSVEGATDGLFLYNTITKMPAIINHPPMDGEELEKSALESSLDNNFVAGDPLKDIYSSSVQQDSVISTLSAEQVPSDGNEVRHLSIEQYESTHLESTECEDNPPITGIDDLGQDRDGNEGPVPSVETSCFSGNAESAQILATHHSTTKNQPQTQNRPRKTEPADNQIGKADLNPPEEPYRLSLQALLKKSQEYRRRQRTLRNQAKNTKIQERTQEQPRKGEEEQGLSDKENDEFPYKGTMTAEGMKSDPPGNQVQFFLSVEASPKKSWENEEKMSGREKEKITCLAGDGNTETLTVVEGEIASKNNHLDSLQEVITEPKQIDTFSQSQPVILTNNSPVVEAFNLTSPLSCSKVERFQTVPTPQFCRSPVHCKNKGNTKAGGAIIEAGAPKSQVRVNTGLNVENKVEPEGNLCPAVSPTLNVVAEGDVVKVLAKSAAQTQQIDQLVFNLSSLKVEISDLESTLTENLPNHRQADSGQKDQHVQFSQNDCDYWEDRPDNDDRNTLEQEQKDAEWQRRQSLDNYKNKNEDTGPEPSSDPKAHPLIVGESGIEAINVREDKRVKISTTEGGRDIGTRKGAQTVSGVAPCRVQWSDRTPPAEDLSILSCGQQEGCKKQQPPTNCITSLAQRMRVPDVFRKVLSVSPKGSVLSDSSNQPTERRIEVAIEGEDSSHCLSLNQSYDVDTPSGLWLLEGSGSDLGSTGHNVQEKHLTPESGGGNQEGVSKAKRRLCLTEGNEERRGETGGGTGWVIGPSSSTPKGHGVQKNKQQQQLKQAHAAQVRALQEEHRRQQQQLLQALAMRYSLLQSVSFPCPMSSSRLRDTVTSPTFSQTSSSVQECYRPLVLAAVKGFLTRRLLRTERVAQLLRTIRDTQQFLQAFQQHTPGRAEFCSKQDILLQERVTLQLRSARYEVHDIFFSLSAGERMQMISWDRELSRERELRRQIGNTSHSRGTSSLSAATQKSLERKRGIMMQKKAAERHKGFVLRAGHKTGFTAEQPSETKRRQIRANPQRVPKTTYSCRPR